MAIKYIDYEGQKLTRQDIYKRFGISESVAYRIMKRNNVSLIQVQFYTAERNSSLDRYIPKEKEKVNTETIEDTIIVQRLICSAFGCNKELSRQEKLFGNKCINHQ